MHLGAVTYNLLKDWSVEEIVRNLEAAGYEAVELRTGHKHGVEPTLNGIERERVRRSFERTKIRLLSFGSTCEFQSPDAPIRAQNVELAKRWIELAHDTGALGVKVRPNGFAPGQSTEATIGWIADCLQRVGDYGAGRGVEIWMEVHGKGTQDPPIAASIMKATNHSQVGLCWNSNPTDVEGGSVRRSFNLLRPWVKTCTSMSSRIRLTLGVSCSACCEALVTSATPYARRRRVKSRSDLYDGTRRFGES